MSWWVTVLVVLAIWLIGGTLLGLLIGWIITRPDREFERQQRKLQEQWMVLAAAIDDGLRPHVDRMSAWLTKQLERR